MIQLDTAIRQNPFDTQLLCCFTHKIPINSFEKLQYPPAYFLFIFFFLIWASSLATHCSAVLSLYLLLYFLWKSYDACTDCSLHHSCYQLFSLSKLGFISLLSSYSEVVLELFPLQGLVVVILSFLMLKIHVSSSMVNKKVYLHKRSLLEILPEFLPSAF